MAQVKHVPPTHPTVYVGLGLATVGLLIAVYAYTGVRVYDIRFAFVALVGGILALGGILTAAWGRSVMAARASRQRRGLIASDAVKVADVVGAEVEPTVAVPKAKRSFDFARSRKKEKEREKAPTATSGGSLFAFKRREEAMEAAVEAVPAAVVEAPPTRERITVKCPDCATVITAEGVRPLAIACPSCGFSDTL